MPENTRPFAPNVVEVPSSGERFEFRQTTEDACVFDFYLAPAGGVPMAHCHARQAEVFRCMRGELSVTIDGSERTLRAGETLELAPGTFHTLLNRGAEECHCVVEYRPAGKNEAWFKILGAVAWKLGREPGMLYVAPFIKDVDIYIQGPPRWAQRALFAVLRPIAIVLGYRRRAFAAAAEVYGQQPVW